MAEINDLEIVDDDNTARFPEGQAPSTVNNGARQLEGIVARWHKDTNASKSSTGSANAYAFAADQTLTAYYDGLEIAFAANFTNDGAATLDVDGVGAQAIVLVDGSALTGGEIVSGQKAIVIFDGTNWQLLNPSFSGLKSLPVGSTIPYVGTVAPEGFVLAEGRTIGNAASGGTERAADDTENLFTLIWDSTTDANAPVTPGGRGTDAASDFAANKTITLPDLRGRSVIGQGTGPDTADGGGAGTARENYEKGGSETYTLTTGQLPSGLLVYDGSTELAGTDGTLINTAADSRTAAGNDDPIDQMHPWQALTNIISLGTGLTNGVGAGSRDASNDTVIATGGVTGRILANRFADVVNVKDYGAAGDGATDDTTAIQAAIDEATTRGSGNGTVVFFPAGTYMASQLVVKRNALLSCSSFRSVILKQISGSNKDFIISENFSSLTGSNKFAPTDPEVPTWFGLKDLIIDGNKANQNNGNCVSFYGSQFLLLGTLWVRDAKENCIYTEGPEQALGTLEGFDSFEGMYADDVICEGNGVYGWEFVGPHNSQIKSYRCILDDDVTSSYGWYSRNSSTATGVIDWIGTTHVYSFSGNTTNRRGYRFAGGTLHIDNLVADGTNILVEEPTPIETGFMSFGKIKLTFVGRNATNLVGMEIQDASVKIDDLEAQTASTGGMNKTETGGATLVKVTSTAENCRISKLNLVDNTTAEASNVGLDVDANFCQFPSVYARGFDGTGSIAVDWSGRDNYMQGAIQNSKTGLNYTGIANNRMDLQIDAGSGQTHVSGTPAVSDIISIRASGVAGVLYTERNLLSSTFAIDSTGVKTVTVAHGALFTPATRQVDFCFSSSTANDWDATATLTAIDATNLTFKVRVATASATGGATARLSIEYDVRGI